MIGVIDIVSRFAEIILAPVQMPDLLWVLIPVYVTWIFIDIYQESRGTAFINSISNGFVSLWVGMDWGRSLTSKLEQGFTTEVIIQGILSVSLLAFGFFVVYEAVKGRKFIKYIARIREVAYIIICVTPIFYSLVPIDTLTLITIAVFFPVWYVVFGIIARIIPKPSVEAPESNMEGITTKELPETEELKLPGMDEEEKPKQKTCPYCDSGVNYVEQYKKYYCPTCKRYL